MIKYPEMKRSYTFRQLYVVLRLYFLGQLCAPLYKIVNVSNIVHMDGWIFFSNFFFVNIINLGITRFRDVSRG
jgi:hypothetical protein